MLDYKCEGMTALYDALRFGILTSNEPKEVVVVTDGQDNSSVTNQEELNGLMHRAKMGGWRFTFIGCNAGAMRQTTDLPFENALNREAANMSLYDMMRTASMQTSLRNNVLIKESRCFG
jgi:Mg-chelatase subunit ChlD